MKRLHLVSVLGCLTAVPAVPALAETACTDLKGTEHKDIVIVSSTAVDGTDASPAHCEVIAQVGTAAVR